MGELGKQLAAGRQVQQLPPVDMGLNQSEVSEVVVGKVGRHLHESLQEIGAACYASDAGTFLENIKPKGALRHCIDIRREPH